MSSHKEKTIKDFSLVYCLVCCLLSCHREKTVEDFGLFMRQFKLSLSKMKLKFIDHCNQMSGRKSFLLVVANVSVIIVVAIFNFVADNAIF